MCDYFEILDIKGLRIFPKKKFNGICYLLLFQPLSWRHILFMYSYFLIGKP